MEEEMDEVLLPNETQRLMNIRHYGLLLFVAASIILTFVTLFALIKA